MAPRRSFLVALLCAVAATVVRLLFLRGDGEPLTTERLAVARALWRAQGPPDDDLALVVSGAQKGKHRIEVRGGKVAKMTTGGAPASPTARAYRIVEGMFRFLETELDNARRTGAACGAGDAEVVRRAAFDERYGPPGRFRSHGMGRPRSIKWRITSWVPR